MDWRIASPDTLPPVEWLTYGSGYLAGMKLGDSPLIDFTRDRLHRETLRGFGEYELTTAYTRAVCYRAITCTFRSLTVITPGTAAGNRIAVRDKYPMLSERFPDNRISQDVENFYPCNPISTQ